MNIGSALFELADCYQAAAGGLHTLHLAMRGREFDTFHRDVLKKYYEDMGDDADDLYEWCALDKYPSLNDAATRVQFTTHEGEVNREIAIVIIDSILDIILEKTNQVYYAADTMGRDSPALCGLAAELQNKLARWSKEARYFNAHRGEQG